MSKRFFPLILTNHTQIDGSRRCKYFSISDPAILARNLRRRKLIFSTSQITGVQRTKKSSMIYYTHVAAGSAGLSEIWDFAIVEDDHLGTYRCYFACYKIYIPWNKLSIAPIASIFIWNLFFFLRRPQGFDPILPVIYVMKSLLRIHFENWKAKSILNTIK